MSRITELLARRTIVAWGASALLLVAAGCHDDDTHSPRDHESPPVPGGVFTTTGDGFVEVGWSPLVGADVAGYEIYSAVGNDPFLRVGKVFGESTDRFLHTGLENGVTRYYEVAAFDFDGNLSERPDQSADLVHDTPRPAGSGLVLFTPESSRNRAGLDWSRFPSGNGGILVSYDDALADYVLESGSGNLLFLRGTQIQDGAHLYDNEIQDFGYTESLDDVDWAPEVGWSENPAGVELIVGHSYIFWTWDDYYGKFRVSGKTNTSVTLDWAYQATDDVDFRFELAPGRKAAASR